MRSFPVSLSIWLKAIALTGFSFTCLPFVMAQAASAAPLDNFGTLCKPKYDKSHACLEELPIYSYHLALPSHYDQALCLSLGNWEGSNEVVVEWDGLQTRHRIDGTAQQAQMLQPAQRQGESSAVILYSQRPILPELIQSTCRDSKDSATLAITTSTWPAPDASHISNLRQTAPPDGLSVTTTPAAATPAVSPSQVSIVEQPQ